MKSLMSAAAFLLGATMAFASPFNQGEAPDVRVHSISERGVPSFLTGELGRLGDPSDAPRVVSSRKALFRAEGNEAFSIESVEADELGQTHVRMQQYHRGLKIHGAEMIVHAGQDGEVFAMNGRFVPGRDLPVRASVDARQAIEYAVAEAGIFDWTAEGEPELSYMVNEKGVTFLTWSMVISYADVEGEQRDRIFADATSTLLVGRHPLIHRAMNRRTYSANNGTSLPGTLKRSEGQAGTSDSTVNAAHDSAGTVYSYYSSKHGRDSYNGSGATITSTVHYSSNYNNAYWNGSQMVYGDGDGSNFAPLAKGFDVVAHELTHAVTDYSANLVYQNESGALNEAMSDVMAAAAEAYRDGGISSNTWKIGEEIYTPGVSGDALRYMNNPTADGSSYDYYPERYTGTQDNGGVHLNSGIANLAFVLAVQGGSHPRGKTSVSVSGLGMSAGERIFYRALTVYMTSSTNFEGARNATAQAAKDLYGTSAESTIHSAWNAVGVPGGPVQVVALSNGQTVSGLSASTGNWLYYSLAVPSGQQSLVIDTWGGSGDADLYVRRGSLPTTSSYDYRPYKNGNTENVTVSSPASGTWYIGIRAYSSFSSVSLKAQYTAPSGGGGGGGTGCTTYTGYLSGSGKSEYEPNGSYYYSSTSGAHTAALSGPSGADFDLFLQKWSGSSWSVVGRSESASSTESISYNGTSGYYRWRVYSYSGSGSFSLCTTKP